MAPFSIVLYSQRSHDRSACRARPGRPRGENTGCGDAAGIDESITPTPSDSC